MTEPTRNIKGITTRTAGGFGSRLVTRALEKLHCLLIATISPMDSA